MASPASQTGSQWTKDSLTRANAPQCVPVRVVQNRRFALKHSGRCKIYLIARRETDVAFSHARGELALSGSSAAALALYLLRKCQCSIIAAFSYVLLRSDFDGDSFKATILDQQFLAPRCLRGRRSFAEPCRAGRAPPQNPRNNRIRIALLHRRSRIGIPVERVISPASVQGPDRFASWPPAGGTAAAPSRPTSATGQHERQGSRLRRWLQASPQFRPCVRAFFRSRSWSLSAGNANRKTHQLVRFACTRCELSAGKKTSPEELPPSFPKAYRKIPLIKK